MATNASNTRSPIGKGRAKVDKDGLTLKQRMWLELYTSDGPAFGNATEAARLAGYNGDDLTLGNIGSENVKKLAERNLLQERISARIEASRISNAEIIGILAQHATANIDDITDDNGCVDLKELKKRKLGHLVKSITPTKFGPRLQMVSQVAALALLAKIRGLEQAPADPARDGRDRALTKAAEMLCLSLGITMELAMERITRADAARSGRILELSAGDEGESNP